MEVLVFSAYYIDLIYNNTFQTNNNMETLGPINTSGITFFSELGRRLTDILGDRRETTYPFQRSGPALQFGGIRWHSEALSRSALNSTSATPACFVFNFCF